ncbi:DUF1524 domain-containing protein [Nocardia sp. ET3-3]|uniref:DUF1524 domain-containing protein n=1 Tax=Nocardia terrae TaxID=2675851 RepID=A0A7K1V8A4_9NOCA|nr:HNH endonuclease family protein [Nocardia terrae]MVU82712.1 DUF1524 domain-containing protein [Nocardia terrae]
MLQKLRSSPALRRALQAALSLLVVIAVTALVAVLEKHGGTGKSADSSGPPAPSGPVQPAGSAKEITSLLGKLKVADEMPMTGYSRDRFPHWDTEKPEHGFGDTFAQYSRCTTRDVVLLRDATGPVKLDPSSCKLTVGKDGGWRDQYGVIDKKTNALKTYKWTTDSSGLDIDHIVALAEAWRSGAANFDDDTRRHIANDALNLVISDPTANRSKGDQDPSTYIPPGNFRCAYIAHYIQVKVKYGLNVDAKEQTALQTAVKDCTAKGEFT